MLAQKLAGRIRAITTGVQRAWCAPFQGQNTGSNPVGDATLPGLSGTCPHLRSSVLALDHHKKLAVPAFAQEAAVHVRTLPEAVRAVMAGATLTTDGDVLAELQAGLRQTAADLERDGGVIGNSKLMAERMRQAASLLSIRIEEV
jgi:hypothetical protein